MEGGRPREPCGVGTLLIVRCRRKVRTTRFRGRRQVASLTGMCPSVHASEASLRSGAPKSREIRTALIERVGAVYSNAPIKPINIELSPKLKGKSVNQRAGH